MELKNYQRQVLDDLSFYMKQLRDSRNLYQSWEDYWQEKGFRVGKDGIAPYNNAIKGVPHVCMKVPTGGGKTFMACCALRTIFAAMPLSKIKTVVWLVPSNSILTQTLRNLQNPDHPYHQRLARDFQGRVGVYTKDELLNGQNFSPDTVREMLTICVLSYDSLRVNSRKKDIRKVYQENGQLERFPREFPYEAELLKNTPENALMQVLRQLMPVTIVDESHNAASALSEEMLNNLNPSFVLDLTATPRRNSNILSYVDARELKKENMVKLPVIVFHRHSRQTVIQDALTLRRRLEDQALSNEKNGGPYIRPIILFQAQPKTKEESEDFTKIKTKLIDFGIPEEQIAIKTSKVDDLGDTDLLSRQCPIRYIITVNALKEGWDCPFAYILASVANKNSTVDVEQILGRILRQPYARRQQSAYLNLSYVFTCSYDFHQTLESVVKGLNGAGFSGKDYRVAQDTPKEELPQLEPMTLEFPENPVPAVENQNETDNYEDIQVVPFMAGEENPALDVMLQQAADQEKEYRQQSLQDKGVAAELEDKMKSYPIQPAFSEQVKNLRLPQFYLHDDSAAESLFAEGADRLLSPQNLSDGFSLQKQDTNIDFEFAADNVYKVDLSNQGEAVPKYTLLSIKDSILLRDQLKSLLPEKRQQKCVEWICRQINAKNNSCTMSDIQAYVKRIVEQMTPEEADAMETAVPQYAKKIEDKIKRLETNYRCRKFTELLDVGTIICRETYTLADKISPLEATAAKPKSLYTKEWSKFNNWENRVIDNLIALSNVIWWHRIMEKKDFYLNGFINHYPDFLLMTAKGHIVLIEAKGDHLANEDSKNKLRLGKTWASAAGSKYRYFMLFEKDPIPGAYTLDHFLKEIMRDL